MAKYINLENPYKEYKYKTPDHRQRKGVNRDKPYCSATTVAGNNCSQRVADVSIRGKRYRLKTCVMHSSVAIQNELGFGPQSKNGRGRKKKITAESILRERFEAEADRYLQPLEDAIAAMKAVVVGNGASAHIQFTDDFAIRLRALEMMLDRIYGRPRQVSEITGADGDAIEVRVPNDNERKLALAAVLQAQGALSIIPPNASASAPTTN